MKQNVSSHYRLYLVKKALSQPLYTLPAALATAGSVLSSLAEPHLPIFGLLITATGMYVGLETSILRFPANMRPQFHNWFQQYQLLCALVPADSGINLRSTSVDPDVILAHLNQMAGKNLSPARYEQFAQTINAAFQSAQRDLKQARDTHETIKFDQIARSIRDETQRIASSVDSYRGAVTSVYGEPAEKEEQQRLQDGDR